MGTALAQPQSKQMAVGQKQLDPQLTQLSEQAQSSTTPAQPIPPARVKKSGVKLDDSVISPLKGPSSSRQKLGSLSSGTSQSPMNHSQSADKSQDQGTTITKKQITEPSFNLFECPLDDEPDVQSELPGQDDLMVYIGLQQL